VKISVKISFMVLPPFKDGLPYFAPSRLSTGSMARALSCSSRRAVLSSYDTVPLVATRRAFESNDVILRHYARHDR
jgi:hypothetical protein